MAIECYEVILSGILAGQFTQNVLHANVNNTTSDPPFVVASALCAEFSGSGGLNEVYTDALPTDFSLTSIRARRILASGGPTQIFLTDNISQTTGQRTGTVSATQVCPLMIWITDANPSKTGRMFLPGVSEADINGNQLQSGLLTALEALGTYWTGGGSLSGGNTWAGAVYRRAAVTSNDINYFRVSPVIGTQRRRLHPV